MFVSIHGQDADPYYWGTAEEKGKDQGLGFNVNVPLPSGTGDQEYLAALKDTINKYIIGYKPDVLVVSLGVDTFEGDPVGTFQITSEAFKRIGSLIKTVGVTTLFVMEGGYDSPELGENVCNVLQGFEGLYSKEC